MQTERKLMDVQISHEPDHNRFVAEANGTRSYIRYVLLGDTLDLVSTYVHPDVRGRFVGEKLVKRALDYARENGWSVIPTCWFVETVVTRNPRYADLLVSR
jgi:hypothetical protein